MIQDFRSATSETLHEFPPSAVLVVGAGAAGLALVLALEEAGVPSVLIESGGDPRDRSAMDARAALNDGDVVGHPYVGLRDGRARVLGGATQLWHGQCVRLQPHVLAPRPWVPHSGWPLALAELVPWYEQAERWFRLSGRGYGPDRWHEHPRLSPLPWSPENLIDDFTEYTPTPHLGSQYHRRLKRSSLVTVMQGATVTKVLLEGRHARGVEVRGLDGRSEMVRGSIVVLATGAIENARILMLSDPTGVGVGTGRAHTGRYLQDHPVLNTLEVHPVNPAWLQDRASHLHRGRRRLYPKVRLAPAAQRREHLLDANAVLVHDHVTPDLDAVRRIVEALRRRRLPDRVIADSLRAVGAAGSLSRIAYRRWAKGLSAGRPASRVALQVWLEQVPDPDSRVRLGAARDPLGLPVAEVDWRIAPEELRTSRVLSQWVADDLERRGLASVRALPAMTDDGEWLASATDAFHPAGTTRMSSSPTDGVVDPDGRVHGLEGLYVAGSSVFPIAGYANPTLTIVALALRLADNLSSQARSASQVA